MSTPQTIPYHQTHTVYGLPACPLCGWRSLVILSYGQPAEGYYVWCDHCAQVEDGGTIEGPRRRTKEGAGKAFNEAMKKFSASFHRGDGGEW